jgi:hypothetical protein
MPYDEADYIRKYVSPCGEDWVERFYKVRNHHLVDEYYQNEHVGEPREGDDPDERSNRWALYSALSRGIDNIRLIALWNDKVGCQTYRDACLVQHMVELMRDTGGQVEIINPSKIAPRVDRAKNDKVTKSQAKKTDASDKQSQK